MAAFKLPSSNLVATALARDIGADFPLTPKFALSGELAPCDVEGVVRFIISEAKFCFFPVLIGTAKIDLAHWKRAIHLGNALGWAVASLSIPAR